MFSVPWLDHFFHLCLLIISSVLFVWFRFISPQIVAAICGSPSPLFAGDRRYRPQLTQSRRSQKIECPRVSTLPTSAPQVSTLPERPQVSALPELPSRVRASRALPRVRASRAPLFLLYNSFLVQEGDWFITVDLKDANFHIQVVQGHRKFLSFAFGGKTYQYKVLPFGLALAQRPFTKSIDAALAPLRLQGIRILNYLDDWLI